jgi:hypothetical protein
MDKTLYVGR